MIKALFVDFYGTVVHEDGAVIKVITQMIKDTGDGSDTSDIGSFWWTDFQTMFLNSFGIAFETQRDLERESLEHTIEKFHSSLRLYSCILNLSIRYIMNTILSFGKILKSTKTTHRSLKRDPLGYYSRVRKQSKIPPTKISL